MTYSFIGYCIFVNFQLEYFQGGYTYIYNILTILLGGVLRLLNALPLCVYMCIYRNVRSCLPGLAQ